MRGFLLLAALTLLLPANALGQEAEEPSSLTLEPSSFTFQLTSPTLAEGISLLPSGSYVLVYEGGELKPYKVPAKYWLMPDPFYEKALVKAKQLDVCRPALEEMTEAATTWQQRTYDEAQRCLNQYDVDGQQVQALTKDLQDMEVRALVAEDRLKQARKRAAVAWAITGGVLLGATSAIVVSVAN